MDKKKIKKVIVGSLAVLGAAYGVLSVVAKYKKGGTVYDSEDDQKNPLEGKKVEFVEDENDPENADGVRGHLVAVGDSEQVGGVYNRYIKRAIDKALSFCGLVALSPVYAAIAIAIKIDDPGPVLFTQKRLGENKRYFKLHKFRSMKMCTPHDVPTHMLDDPDQYITRVGKFLRKSSLDELPQIWDIFVGNMSIIGPRPGLWNQDLLTAERDKYGANDVKPGLTGLAQISGRDELEIPVKARLDGEYVEKQSFFFDMKCFFGTIKSVLKHDGVVEGGTGEMKKQDHHNSCSVKPVDESQIQPKRILITGANSYIGDNVRAYLNSFSDKYCVDILDMIGVDLSNIDLKGYDVVFNVAGIAHRKETSDIAYLYYDVNEHLVVELAKKAKQDGVKQFIVLSSMSVYGKNEGYINKQTKPFPNTHYGISKLLADDEIVKLDDERFRVAIVRPPMVYGKGCKGNYQTLRKFAVHTLLFPEYSNQRSMIYIGNLAEFIKLLIDNGSRGIFLPQNGEYVSTSALVYSVAKIHSKRLLLTKLFNPALSMAKIMNISVIQKVFGNLIYEKVDCVDKFNFLESIEQTEGKE